MNNKFWIPVFTDGTLLCIIDGKLKRMSLDAISNVSNVFQFWSGNSTDYVNFWKDHPETQYDEKDNPLEEGFVLVLGGLNEAGELELS